MKNFTAQEAKELVVTEPTKPAPQEQSIARMNRETTITKELEEELKKYKNKFNQLKELLNETH